MRAAFGWDLETSILHGGLPGAAPLVNEQNRRRAYVAAALIETTIPRDILQIDRYFID
jgi:hypothetical protein